MTPAPPSAALPLPGLLGWPWAWPLRALLAVLYGAALALWALPWRLGWRQAARAACPVLSVGNLTVGGSGKTPVADWLLGLAAARGLRPALLTRGYGARTRATLQRVRLAEGAPASARSMGDEPFLLAHRHPELPVFVGRRRADAARLAAVLDAPDLLVLDDGYQHRALARDLNVLLVDAERSLGNGHLLPLGPLREPLAALRRADVVLISKANLGVADAVRQRLQALGVRVPTFRLDYRPVRLRPLAGGAETRPPEDLQGRALRLVCGVAQPAGFRHAVEALGARVLALQAFPDHHAYREEDAAGLRTAQAGDAAGTDAPWLLTTEKDAAKLAPLLADLPNAWVLEMGVVPEAAADAYFQDWLAGLTSA